MKETKLMKFTRLLSASALSLLLGTTALLYAQEQHEDAKPQEEPRPEASKPAQDETKAPRQDEAKPQKQDQDKDKSGQAEDKAAKKDDAKAAKQAQRTSGQGGSHIPDDKFRAHFGRQHTFVVNHVTTVGGQPQFQYGGYSFTMVEAWPMGWAYTDQCYIDYIDGEYFLFDLLHPGVQVALVVVL
jgi:hypothetical protein